MGTMTFLTPLKLSAETARELERACVADGPDSMPWPTRAGYEPGRLTVQRDVDESGYLAVPWEINGVGRIMATTATLMERPAPYQLQVELARGKVNQLRCQAADWQAGGLRLSESVEENIRKAGGLFGQAVTEPNPERQSEQARAALEVSYHTSDELTRLYIAQVFEARHERTSRLDTALGCRLTGGQSVDKLAHLLPLC